MFHTRGIGRILDIKRFAMRRRAGITNIVQIWEYETKQNIHAILRRKLGFAIG